MKVKEVKRRDGSKGFLIGDFIHSEKRMATIGLPFAIQREQEKKLRKKTSEPVFEYKWCRLSDEDEFFLTGKHSDKPFVPEKVHATANGVTANGSIVFDGAEFTPEEVHQLKRIKVGLSGRPGKFEIVRSAIVDAKKRLSMFGIEIDQESASKTIASCL